VAPEHEPPAARILDEPVLIAIRLELLDDGKATNVVGVVDGGGNVVRHHSW
jgi:hypothetical protein